MGDNKFISNMKALIAMAIDEDIGAGDVTSTAVFGKSDQSKSIILSKDDGIFCGSDAVTLCYEMINPDILVSLLASDGDRISRGQELVKIEGSTLGILAGERISLNFMQRMSGIATKTDRLVSLTEGSKVKILDTRKTLPGFRMLDKYSVKTGGGENHRIGLYDMVMIKDNHIKAAGGIKQAVELVRNIHGDRYQLEVETTGLEEVREAADSGSDIIMLDNMDNELIMKCIEVIKGRSKIEVSGNIDEKRIKELSKLDIDYISVGSLTHSVRAFDLSMRFID